MKKLFYIILTVGTLFIWCSGTARAEGEKNYTSFKIGRYHGSNGGYDRPIGFEIAAGRMFTQHVGLELGYGRYELFRDDSGDRPAWLSLDKPALGHWTEDDTLTISPLTLTLRAVSSNDYSVAYLGGGVGMYFVDYEAEFKTELEGKHTFNDSETIYGVHIETGIGYNTLERIYLGIGLRLNFTEATGMLDRFKGLTARQQDRLNGYIVTGEVSFKF